MLPLTNATFTASSLESSSVPLGVRTSLLESRVDEVARNAFKVIHYAFPIATVFDPRLKIRLDLLINDQKFFQKIAQFLLSIKDVELTNVEQIKIHFNKSTIEKELLELVKNNPERMEAFYQACFDALSLTTVGSCLEEAISGRIFTLNNALIASCTPGVIQGVQRAKKIPVQELDAIKNEGERFVRECLFLHLRTLSTESEEIPFKTTLSNVVTALIPFVRYATEMSLRENKHPLHRDIDCLSYRNPTGYNYHGIVAATIMEFCLNTLGFKTKLLFRSDLNPLVTLATAHAIVAVFGPSDTTFIVDPCYHQFIKDVALEGQTTLTAPVLVLEESEVLDFVERHIMTLWRSNYRRIMDRDEDSIKEAQEKDQFWTYIADKIPSFKTIYEESLESHAINSFLRVWSVSSYRSVCYNQEREEVMFSAPRRPLHQLIQEMGIPGATSYLSLVSCENELREASARSLHRKEVIQMIAHLSRGKRKDFAYLVDCDQRLSEIGYDPLINGYWRSVRSLVNPEGRDLHVLYACAGADVTSVLLATDATRISFVDLSRMDFTQISQALLIWKSETLRLKALHIVEKEGFLVYFNTIGGSRSSFSNGEHIINNFAYKLFFALEQMGVDLESVTISNHEAVITIEFDWLYFGSLFSKRRRIELIQADITKPEEYPPQLQEMLRDKIDLFFMKSAFFVPRSYPQFLPSIASAIKTDGFLMTSDLTFTMQEYNPEATLLEHGINFRLKTTEAISDYKSVLVRPIDPFTQITQLEMHRKEDRANRNPGSDHAYWVLLNLRQIGGDL